MKSGKIAICLILLAFLCALAVMVNESSARNSVAHQVTRSTSAKLVAPTVFKAEVTESKADKVLTHINKQLGIVNGSISKLTKLPSLDEKQVASLTLLKAKRDKLGADQILVLAACNKELREQVNTLSRVVAEQSDHMVVLTDRTNILAEYKALWETALGSDPKSFVEQQAITHARAELFAQTMWLLAWCFGLVGAIMLVFAYLRSHERLRAGLGSAHGRSV